MEITNNTMDMEMEHTEVADTPVLDFVLEETKTTAVASPTEDTIPVKPKKTRKPRTTKTISAVRDLSELRDIEPKKMTDAEKNLLIEAQKKELVMLRTKADALSENCKRAYEKCNLYESDFNRMDTFYREKLAFVAEQMNAFQKTIKLATGGIN